MKKTLISPLLILAFFAFGCSLIDKFKTASDANSNAPKTTPTPLLSPTPSPLPDVKPTPLDKAILGKNLLGFGAGTMVIAQTSEARVNDTFTGARTINNEGMQGGWETAKGQIENQNVTLELPARTTLKTLVFDTYYGYTKQKAARDIRVEISDVSANDGFQTILTTTLQDGKDNQLFSVESEIAGRYIRYTALNNYGSPDYTRTGEIRGYGEQDPIAPLENLSGTYKNKEPSTYGGLIHLKQEGSFIIGCYEGGNQWTFQGGIEGRVMSYKMQPKQGHKFSGTAIFTPDGKKFTELTWANDKKSYDTLNFGEKTSDRIGNCESMPNLDGAADVVKDKLTKDLAELGKTILYGINFDFNSDVIRPESRPMLGKVIAILKEKPDWKFSVEGHTDNVGGDAFNQSLSEKRAAAVKTYLTAAGVEAGRLSSIGYGLTKPLAPNNSEAERAQNRRVELIKQ